MTQIFYLLYYNYLKVNFPKTKNRLKNVQLI